MIINGRYDKLRVIRQLYPTVPNDILADMLGTTANYVGVTARRMGMRKSPEFLSAKNSECARKRWARKS